jgi:hypothetical protein
MHAACALAAEFAGNLSKIAETYTRVRMQKDA